MDPTIVGILLAGSLVVQALAEMGRATIWCAVVYCFYSVVRRREDKKQKS